MYWRECALLICVNECVDAYRVRGVHEQGVTEDAKAVTRLVALVLILLGVQAGHG